VTRLLVVDDDDDLRSLVRGLLTRAGFEVLEAAAGRAALRVLHAERPALVVLDVGLPDLDGWQVLERIRDLSDLPVIMLTARDEELDRVRGLRAGADDYVVKPFGRLELLARIEALLRRADPPAHRDAYRDGLLEVDFAQRTVQIGGEPAALTPREFRLLAALVQHADKLLSHERLLALAWDGEPGSAPEQVTLYVSYLRRKLAAADPGGAAIETVRGFGYRYRPPAG
jgi:DNA-binding response OmpR family regulator